MEKHNLEDLNQLYQDAESCDDELFAEMRSNILLVSGNHYSKKTSTFFSRIRNSQKLNENQKLRLTKNHIQKITKHYVNAILSKAPGVTVAPQNDLEMQDKKSAELNESVWKEIKREAFSKDKVRRFAHDFVEIGEACAFVYYDPNAGKLKGYEPLVDEQGQMQVDMMTGQPVPDQTKPVFEGQLVYKNIPGYNLLRDPGCKDMKNSPVHIIREMVAKKDLLASYGDDKKNVIGESDDEEFVVFDSNKNNYSSSKHQVLVRYHFFKPCRVYPMGYYYISTARGILEEGEIPFGIYPIVWEGFDTFSGHPRGFSIIKVARPFQAEINRASSQAATHQITVGDDKIIYQGNTKLAPGALLPGVRGITFQGAPPQILPGRSGDQFIPYITGQISEMYAACMLEEINQEEPAQMDPYTMLFRSASQQQKHAQTTEKFEGFLKACCMTGLELMKKYMPDDAIINATGKSEAINIAEFKSTTPLQYLIKIEEQSETIESRLGKQMAINQVIQYVGGQLTSKQIGLLLKEMPYLNNNFLVQHLYTDYKNVENDMLAMERGERPFTSPYADNQVYVDAVTYRMKQADFRLLPPQVQHLYDEYLGIHEQELARKAQAEQSAKDGFIPSSGALITCSMQMPDPQRPGSTQQVRLPYEALIWLIKRLEAQGSSLQAMEQMNQGALAQIAGMMPQQQMMAPQGQMLPQQPGMGVPH